MKTKKSIQCGRLIIAFIIVNISSCEKFISVPPPGGQLDPSKVFSNEKNALAALSSVYYRLSEDIDGFAGGGGSSVTITQGTYADELICYLDPSNSQGFDFYINNVQPTNSIISGNWNTCYSIIYECNRIIESLTASSNISEVIKNQFTGEAKFIRAFCNFYLINLYGPVPLVTSSDYALNSTLGRMDVDDIYQNILEDLNAARGLLADNYPSSDRVRVNKGSVIALMARVYLYNKDYVSAEIAATEIIEKTTQYKLLTNLDAVFLKTSQEAIWQLLPRGGAINYTNEGYEFIFRAGPPPKYSLRISLYESFESGDTRRDHWTNSISSTSGLTKWYFANKYKENTVADATGMEYSMVLRLAEQYLIRAEARVKLNKLSGANSATTDIDSIRVRAGLLPTTALSASELLTVIEKERRSELFTEWGHRFFDLKRWGKLDAVLGSVKTNWNTTDSIWPIPQSEILLNTNLIQNEGYN